MMQQIQPLSSCLRGAGRFAFVIRRLRCRFSGKLGWYREVSFAPMQEAEFFYVYVQGGTNEKMHDPAAVAIDHMLAFGL